MRNGQHIGAFALYGYKKDPEQKGHLIIDEEAAEVVREVFRLFVQGRGKQDIARTLNARGIPNPTEYKRQKGLRYSQPKSAVSTLWKYFAVYLSCFFVALNVCICVVYNTYEAYSPNGKKSVYVLFYKFKLSCKS